MNKTKIKGPGQPSKGLEPTKTNIKFYKNDRAAIERLLKANNLKHLSDLLRLLIAEADAKI